VNADKLRPCWRAETGIFLGLWLFFLVVGRSKLFLDPGTFWHTVVGERILSSGQLIHTDPFTFTWHGRHWIAHQWLGECLMAMLHRIDGLDTLLLATATLLGGLYTWIAHRFIRAGLHWSLTVVVILIVLGTSASHFHIRPHLATIVLLGVTMGYIVDFEQGRIGLWRLAGLVPIYLLWTNLHGGTLGGLATLGLALAGWCAGNLLFLVVRRLWAGSETSDGNHLLPDTGRLLGFAGILAVCSLTVVVTPYGDMIFRTWLNIWGSGLLTQIIVEHKPLDVSTPDGWMVVVLAAVYFTLLLSALPNVRISWIVPMVWLYLAFDRVRNAPLFAVTAAIVMADVLPFTRIARWLESRGSDLYRPAADPSAPSGSDFRPALLPALAVAAALFLQVFRIEAPVVGHGWARLDPAYWPIDLLPELQDSQNQNHRPDGTPIFNEYLDGGFLIYFAPGYRVFIDDRCELYHRDEDQVRYQWLYELIHGGSTDPGAAVRRWEKDFGKFDFALVRSRQAGEIGYDTFFRSSPEWRIVRQTPTATFYRRVLELEKSTGPGR
jgi:hypothetical protein